MRQHTTQLRSCAFPLRFLFQRRTYFYSPTLTSVTYFATEKKLAVRDPAADLRRILLQHIRSLTAGSHQAESLVAPCSVPSVLYRNGVAQQELNLFQRHRPGLMVQTGASFSRGHGYLTGSSQPFLYSHRRMPAAKSALEQAAPRWCRQTQVYRG